MNRMFDSPGSDNNPPRMIVEHKGYWYMTSRPEEWELALRPHGFNAGDSCWWTGLAVITYDDVLLEQGLLQLTPIKGKTWRRYIWDNLEWMHPVDDFTRDQLISAVTALVYKDLPSAELAIANTPKWRLSKSTLSRIDLLLWLNAIKHNSNWKGKAYAKLFAGSTAVKKSFVLLWKRLIEWIIGSKVAQVHPNDMLTTKGYTLEGWREFMNKHLRPKGFPTHLCALQLFALRYLELTKAPLASKIVRRIAGKYNYLVYLLTGKEVSKDEIRSYIPHEGWVWQGHLDSLKTKGSFCTQEEEKYNAMDKDILWVLYNEL